MTLHLVLPAAGVGRRFGRARPKQYSQLHGRTILEWTLSLWQSVAVSGQRLLVLGADDDQGRTLARGFPGVRCVNGGAERAESVLAGLNALEAAADDWVMVHDVARPCVRVADIEKLRDYCRSTGQGALLAAPLTDTIKHRSDAGVTTLNRHELWAALTPQCFRVRPLRSALEAALARGDAVTDEASAMEWAGQPVGLVEGAADNIKLTRPEDLALVGFYLTRQGRLINHPNGNG